MTYVHFVHMFVKIFSNDQQEFLENIIEQHKTCNNSENIVCSLTKTGIGDVLKIHCTICGFEENITDYSTW